MDVRQSIHSAHAKTLDTQGLRNEFLVEKVFVADEYTMVYSHIDRIIVGGIMPVTKTVSVGGEVGKQLGVSYGRCEQVPDMRSSYSSGAHPRGTS